MLEQICPELRLPSILLVKETRHDTTMSLVLVISASCLLTGVKESANIGRVEDVVVS